MDRQKHFFLPRPDRLITRFRARRTKPSLDPVSIAQILSAYDLELTGEPHVPPGRGRSKSIIVITDQGKKVLKRYKDTVLDSMIEYEHSVVDFLNSTGFHVPKILPAKNGSTISSYSDARFVLFDFVEDGFHYHNYWYPPSQERKFISTSGKNLAELHGNLKNFVPQGYNPNGFIDIDGDRERNLGWYLDQLEKNQAQITPTAEGKWDQAIRELHSQAGKIQDSLAALEGELGRADLPKQVIHGDYGPYNILFKDNKVIAVLDFELARLDWRITDLVYALPRFAETRLGFNFSKVNCLLDAYRSSYDLDNNELRLIPRIWKYFRIKRGIVCWSRYYETQQNFWLDYALVNLQRAEIMTNREDQFLDQLHFK